MDKSPAYSLAGVRVVVTRPADQCAGLCELLKARGAVPVLFPLIHIEPLADWTAVDRALMALEKFEWVLFTSQNAVRQTLHRCEHLRINLADFAKRLKIGVVGPATAKMLEAAGLPVAYTSPGRRGAALAEELSAQLAGRRVLLPRSDLGDPDLPETLSRIGAKVTEVAVYRTLALPPDGAALSRALGEPPNAVVFFSPSAVRAFVENGGAEIAEQCGAAIVAIGPVTGRELRERGIRNVIESEDTTGEAVIQTLKNCFPKSRLVPSARAKGTKG